MHIEGTHTLLAPPERVWHGMRNQQILLRTVPGLREIEALDEHTFAISLTMDQEPFIGNCLSNNSSIIIVLRYKAKMI